MTILIDPRTGSKDLLNFPPLSYSLPSYSSYPLYSPGLCDSSTLLDSADVMFCGNGPEGTILIGIEVKSITDLLDSCVSGRLQATQISKMTDSYDLSYLLYYGDHRRGDNGELLIRRGQWWKTYPEGAKRPLPYNYLRSRLLEISCCGMHYEYIPCEKKKTQIAGKWIYKYDLSPIAQWIYDTYNWFSRPWESHKGFRTLDKTRGKIETNPLRRLAPDDESFSKFKARVEVAAQFPGVKFERAVRIAQHFTSVREMVNADEKEYAKIEGIGKVIARSIKEFLS